MTEDAMVGWHHQLDGHEFEQTPGDSDGQGSLACCSPWCHRGSDMTEQWQQYLAVGSMVDPRRLIQLEPWTMPLLGRRVFVDVIKDLDMGSFWRRVARIQ